MSFATPRIPQFQFASFVCGSILWAITTFAHAAPQLVTLQLSPAVKGDEYIGSLIIGSDIPLSSVVVTGLPAGMTATHNGSGGIAFAGTPTVFGSFPLTVAATDAAAGTLSASVVLTVVQSAANLSITNISGGGAFLSQTIYSSFSGNTCAVVSGGVQCWGGNDDGKLGNGSTIPSNRPVQAIVPASKVTAVATGGNHTCAVVDGGVKCWGNNFAGKLGIPDYLGVQGSLVPVEAIAAGSGATGVAVGVWHSCAIVLGGVKCWGDNFRGQLGIGNTAQPFAVVDTIPAGSNVTAMSAGGDHTCVVVGGGVQCWGANSYGQLGNNSTSASSLPVQTIATASKATAVSAGQEHTCAVVDGGAQCWGSNNAGKLGNNDFLQVQSNVPVQTIPPAKGVTSIAAGGLHSCAIVNGGVQCWGGNGGGQLGNNSPARSFVPIETLAAGSNAKAISAGVGHTCAVAGARVLCWGFPSELGNDNAFPSLVPVSGIAPGGNVSAIAAARAGTHTCAVRSGGVRCWNSQIANTAGGDNSYNPVDVIAAGSNVSAVSNGAGYSCAVVDAGVQCWGINPDGQLGVSGPSGTPVPVAAIPAGSSVVGVSAGRSHTCALLSGGVQCWGANDAGQLGNNSTASSFSPVQAIPAGSGVTAISSGNSHTCAVVSAGVQCWGANFSGQLGINSTVQSLVPVQVIAAGSGATAIAAGSGHTCAVVGGGAQCWGANFAGALGNNSTAQSLVPVQSIVAGSGVTAVTVGGDFSCAVILGGVQCWGRNFSGNLGNNGTSNSLIPVQTIPAGSNVSAVSAGFFYACALVGGGFACWGEGQVQNRYTLSGPRPVTAFILGGASLTGVLSRKVHGSVGTFDVAVDSTQPVNGLVTVEPRTIGTGHTIIFQFDVPVTASGTASVTPAGAAVTASSGNEVSVNLTGVPDNQRISITLAEVNGAVSPPPVSIGFLVGDVNNTRSVNSSDISGVKARSGQSASAANFKFDLNASGAVNSSDISAVKARSGLMLP